MYILKYFLQENKWTSSFHGVSQKLSKKIWKGREVKIISGFYTMTARKSPPWGKHESFKT